MIIKTLTNMIYNDSQITQNELDQLVDFETSWEALNSDWGLETFNEEDEPIPVEWRNAINKTNWMTFEAYSIGAHNTTL